MSSVSFASLPLIVRLTTAVSIFMAWAMIAEFVIDRHGLDRFLPLYRVGNLCLYDGAVIVAILVFWIAAHR